jgi:hypothetical protein
MDAVVTKPEASVYRLATITVTLGMYEIVRDWSEMRWDILTFSQEDLLPEFRGKGIELVH